MWIRTLAEPPQQGVFVHYWLGGLKGGLELQKWGSLMLIWEEDRWWRRKEEEGYDTERQDRAIKIMLPRRLWTRGKASRGRLQVVSECRRFSSLILVVTSCLNWGATQGRKKLFGKYYFKFSLNWFDSSELCDWLQWLENKDSSHIGCFVNMKL